MESTTTANGKVEEIFLKKTPVDDIRRWPEKYLGSIHETTRCLYVWEDNQMIKRPISYVPGFYRIFDEIILNAADHKKRDPNMNSLKVSINVEENLITVYNNGIGIPVHRHEVEGIYVPELVFSRLLTSSNFDNHGGGHGYGAKLTNLFSSEFTVHTSDGNYIFNQVFRDNMDTIGGHVLDECDTGETWTSVSFKPDLAKFGMLNLHNDILALLKKRVVDLAGCLGPSVEVLLDDNRLPLKNFKDYVDLYPHTSQKQRIYEKVNDYLELCLCLSDGQFTQISFVNTISTLNGGTHVEYITDQITSFILEVAKKHHKDAQPNADKIRNHLCLFVNAQIDNPRFESQTKETLTSLPDTFGSKCKLSLEFLQKLETSDLVKKVLARVLKKPVDHKVPKVLDAAFAGDREKAKNCTLILTEGNSAKLLVVSGLVAARRNYYGVFPLKGKPPNARELNSNLLDTNAVLRDLIKVLGLEVNKEYLDAKTLKYGHLMIMTDPDHDGVHIKGLIVNLLHKHWPSLLTIPEFLQDLRIPLLKAMHTKSEEVREFYTEVAYNKWKDTFGDKVKEFKIKHYKGLATSSPYEGVEHFAELIKHTRVFIWNGEADGKAIELAFSKSKSKDRQKWIKDFQLRKNIDSIEKSSITYKEFFDNEFICFSLAHLRRSVPCLVDGLKPSQRKILFCALTKPLVQEIRVSQLSADVSKLCAYRHGEKNLANTIIGMAQNHMGKNNINLLYPSGHFGTRLNGGKNHASSHYLSTKLSSVTRHLFNKADECLLTFLTEDGLSIEPSWYFPIIPMVLVNGCNGVGTGWRTFVPCYNPRNIIENLIRLMEGKEMVPMDPWYKSFLGPIFRRKKGDGTYYFEAFGVIKEISGGVTITELPIGVWSDDYNKFLKSAVESDLIKRYTVHSDAPTIHIDVEMSASQLESAKIVGLEKAFKLITKIETSDMNLFDPAGVIEKYKTAEEILETFYPLRLHLYADRKKAMISEIEKASTVLEKQIQFIDDSEKNKLEIFNKKIDILCAELIAKGYGQGAEAGAEQFKDLLSMTLQMVTWENRTNLFEEMNRKKEQIKILEETDPKDMWKADLKELEKQLAEQDSIDEEERENIRKLIEKGQGGSAATDDLMETSSISPEREQNPMDASGSSSENEPDLKMPRIV